MTTTTTAQSSISPTNHNNNSTDILIRNILLNQSTEYYDDELILEQMLAAANMSQPPPETWRAIVNLLTRGMNITHLQHHLLNNRQNDSNETLSSSITKQTKNGKTISLLTFKHDADDDKNNQQKNTNHVDSSDDDDQNLTILKSTKSHLESAIDEFPPDFMTDDFRQKGGFIVHIIIFIYLSLALAVICDDYFLKSLEYISEG
ncbi:hypothetical protein BLA29_006585 [Euroglyphus maynei]|uniref:Uncharacterized protein n=1 Tax=Euroglyphus maynei TaxID=6958 RepID=A0A1Y3BP84_EURMA|nr:hypothetical protein BLA29_006585 [Euroglyphus maynei]